MQFAIYEELTANVQLQKRINKYNKKNQKKNKQANYQCHEKEQSNIVSSNFLKLD